MAHQGGGKHLPGPAAFPPLAVSGGRGSARTMSRPSWPWRRTRPERGGQAVRERRSARRLAAALAGLSGRQRSVFVLRHYEDRSLEEIAGILGLEWAP